MCVFLHAATQSQVLGQQVSKNLFGGRMMKHSSIPFFSRSQATILNWKQTYELLVVMAVTPVAHLFLRELVLDVTVCEHRIIVTFSSNSFFFLVRGGSVYRDIQLNFTLDVIPLIKIVVILIFQPIIKIYFQM